MPRGRSVFVRPMGRRACRDPGEWVKSKTAKENTDVTSSVAITVCAAMVGVCQTAVAQERKIERSQLPAAVERAVAAQSQAATIRGFSQATEHGQTFYEVEMTVSGHGKDVLMDPTELLSESRRRSRGTRWPPAGWPESRERPAAARPARASR